MNNLKICKIRINLRRMNNNQLEKIKREIIKQRKKKITKKKMMTMMKMLSMDSMMTMAMMKLEILIKL